jgi:hypothetical protein
MLKIGSLGQNIGKNGSAFGEISVHLQGIFVKIGSHFTSESVAEPRKIVWDFFLLLS